MHYFINYSFYNRILFSFCLFTLVFIHLDLISYGSSKPNSNPKSAYIANAFLKYALNRKPPLLNDWYDLGRYNLEIAVRYDHGGINYILREKGKDNTNIKKIDVNDILRILMSKIYVIHYGEIVGGDLRVISFDLGGSKLIAREYNSTSELHFYYVGPERIAPKKHFENERKSSTYPQEVLSFIHRKIYFWEEAQLKHDIQERRNQQYKKQKRAEFWNSVAEGLSKGIAEFQNQYEQREMDAFLSNMSPSERKRYIDMQNSWKKYGSTYMNIDYSTSDIDVEIPPLILKKVDYGTPASPKNEVREVYGTKSKQYVTKPPCNSTGPGRCVVEI